MTDFNKGEKVQTRMSLTLGAMGFATGVINNLLRHRPAMYQPWIGLFLSVSGLYWGSKLGQFYDDSNSVLNEQFAIRGAVPLWAKGNITEEEERKLNRDLKLESFKAKFHELAAIEEKEYLEGKQ